MSDDLVKRLTIKASVMEMGEKIAWGSDTSLMREAADRIEELETEIARLRQLIPRPEQTEDELVWRDYMRGVPLAALAKEFGITKERMRHRLKRIAENKLHLTE